MTNDKVLLLEAGKPIVKKDHKKEYRFGIELECFMDMDNAPAFHARVQVLPSNPFTIGVDGSISTDEYNQHTMEIRTNGGKSYTTLTRSVKKLSDLCRKFDVKVNTSCGFHLHVSNKRFFTQRNLKRIIMTWVALEDVMIATQPRSRFNNSYCRRYLKQYLEDNNNGRSVPKGKEALISEMGRNNRYYAMNLSALRKHGTIEIRLHAGTTDDKKIIAWVNLMLAVFEYALHSYNHTEVMALFNEQITDKKVEKVFQMLGIDKNTKKYFEERISKFMFVKLAQQQASAILIVANAVKMRRLRKSYERANARLSVANDELRSASRVFQE